MSLLAIGGAIGMVEKVMKGEAQNGYGERLSTLDLAIELTRALAALINPPGHHAEPGASKKIFFYLARFD